MASKQTLAKNDEPPKIESLFFDSRDGGYWYEIKNRFFKLGTKDVRMHLRTRGLRDDIFHKGLRELDFPLWDAQMNRVVDYAGALAGHRVGVSRNSSGSVILVTQEVSDLWQDFKGKPKAPKWFFQFVQELLPGDQWLYFCHWLKIALASLRNCDFRPGQVVVLAGPSECGKSLMQSIITEVLGGRQANPFPFMMGEKFNYELAGAEHWRIEDPASTTDIRARRYFGAKLKEATVNSEISINQKGKDALLLTIGRRVTISVNDEPENLSVIPPLDDSIKDKIFLFRCDRVEKSLAKFLDDRGELDRKKLWDTIAGEIKAVRGWLFNGLADLPLDLRNRRFGVKSWHHPELLAELANLSPESRLFSLLDAVLFENYNAKDIGFYEGKAIDIEKALRASQFAFEADKLLKYHGACGTYLSRLEKQQGERISRRLKDGYAVWRIQKPSITNNNEEENGN